MCAPQVDVYVVSCCTSVYSCVHKSRVHLYKCIVVQYICMWIYIYKTICPWLCPVYMSCTFLIHRCGVHGWTWAFLVSRKEIWNFYIFDIITTLEFSKWKRPRIFSKIKDDFEFFKTTLIKKMKDYYEYFLNWKRPPLLFKQKTSLNILKWWEMTRRPIFFSSKLKMT